MEGTSVGGEGMTSHDGGDVKSIEQHVRSLLAGPSKPTATEKRTPKAGMSMGLVDTDVMQKMCTLKALKAGDMIDSPEFKVARTNILRHAGFVIEEEDRDRSVGNGPQKRGSRSVTPRQLRTGSSSESDDDESSLTGATLSAEGDASRTKKRRRLRNIALRPQFEKRCKTVLWVHYESGAIEEYTVPFEFKDSNGDDLTMWSENDDGVWSCTMCRAKTKGCTFDPEKNKRLDSKLEHNQYKEHTKAVMNTCALPAGAIRFVPWGKEFAKYKHAVEWYQSASETEREGVFTLAIPQHRVF